MPLRTPNDPAVPAVLLRQLALIIPGSPSANTQLAASSQSGNGSELVFVRDKGGMIAQNKFPAVNLSVSSSRRGRTSRNSYAGETLVVIEYYDRWDQNPASMDAISIGIGDDLERIKANLEDNDTLTTGGVSYGVTMPDMVISGDKPYMDTTFPGITLLFRTLHVPVTVLDYTVAFSPG